MPGPLVRRAILACSAFSILACSAFSLLALASQPFAAAARSSPPQPAGGTRGASKAVGKAPLIPGSRLWRARYKPGGANSLGVSPDGTKVFVIGSSWLKRSNFDYATVAYDASTGAELWVKRYNGPGNGQDQALSLGVSHDGTRVFVTGWSAGVSSSIDYATLAYDASTGKRLWLARYNGPANSSDQARSLAVSPDGTKLFVTGNSYGVTSNGDYATVAYDASTGAKLWVKRYSSPGNQYDQANAVAVSLDSTIVFVTGQSGGSQSDYVTIAYDATSGAPRWVKRYSSPGSRGSLATSLGVMVGGVEEGPQGVISREDAALTPVLLTRMSLNPGYSGSVPVVKGDPSRVPVLDARGTREITLRPLPPSVGSEEA